MTEAPELPAPISALVGPVIRDLARRSNYDVTRWLHQVDRLRGCREPIRLTGESMTIDTQTGELLRHYATTSEPHGQLLVRCGNRRQARCPACAETYRRDTFHLIRAGLLGGDKNVPATVRTHPRVLATFTAPTFGPVHRGPGKDGVAPVCHPRRNGLSCFTRHQQGNPAIGQPLDPDAYDYVGHILWNAHAGDLWRRFTIYLRRHLAAAAGLTRKTFNETVRISFAKVAEYQTRGVVHFHAVIRLDSRTQDNTPAPPPIWATVELLDDAVHSAARAVHLSAPELGQPTRELVWGDQLDVKHIDTADSGNGDMTEVKVAGYIAKYATKAAESSGTLDRPMTSATILQLHRLDIADHPAHLIRTAWRLGNPITHPDLVHLRLRDWAHMLGFRGHFSTKSRAYSTTLGDLRQARIDWTRARLPHDPETTFVLGHWQYAGQGFTPGESALAASFAPEVRHGR
ncbi:replication initiator [Nonomuraea aurantiaca]|uniref:replication initiator n=1 Tax=Nonomuraea aurantiaca TaxID=2878562 RepID=UPI001CD95997|nr:replication initiator [Nonomuraea aurantiaca]MCA2223489.1 replication initiation protein [Nonomuraea aurantiaca]